MSTTISILGCGRTGVQTAVFLLDQFSGQVIIYDDDVSYAQGMTLDCMQAASVEAYRGSMRATKSLGQLRKADILIICEQRDEKLSEQWEKIAKEFSGLCIYAGQNIKDFKTFVQKIPQKSKHLYFAVHGIVDAGVLAAAVSKKLDVSIKDIEVAVRGGIGAKMQSKETWVRAGGIPVDEIKKGTYKVALALAQKTYDPLKKGPWSFYYAFAAAAAKASLWATSAKSALLSITTEKGNIPAVVNKKGYVAYSDVKGGVK